MQWIPIKLHLTHTSQSNHIAVHFICHKGLKAHFVLQWILSLPQSKRDSLLKNHVLDPCRDLFAHLPMQSRLDSEELIAMDRWLQFHQYLEGGMKSTLYWSVIRVVERLDFTQTRILYICIPGKKEKWRQIEICASRSHPTFYRNSANTPAPTHFQNQQQYHQETASL